MDPNRTAVAAVSGVLDVSNRTTVCRVRGSLGQPEASALREVVETFTSRRRVVLDLRRMRFIDGAGLHALVALIRHEHQRAVPVKVLPPRGPVGRALQAAGFEKIVTPRRWAPEQTEVEAHG